MSNLERPYYEELTRLNNDLVNLQRELHVKNRELAALTAMKEELFSLASHELKTPLTVITGAVDILRGMLAGEVGPDAAGFVVMIDHETRRLRVLVEEMLEISRLETTRGSLVLGPVNMHDLAVSTLHDLSPVIAKVKHESCCTVPGDLVARADPVKVARVMTNLMTNAIKYTPPGGRVHVDGRLDGDRVEVSVHDTGVGLEPDDIERLFTRFGKFGSIQASQAGQTSTGLGLYLVKQVLDAHGGGIRVSSPGKGKGSTFTFWLPAHRP